MAFKLFGVFLPLICALQSPRFLSWSNENKEGHSGEKRRKALYLLLFHQPCSFTYLPFFFSSPFLGKVNLFIQSQQGDLDTPTQLRSLSMHPCQGELSLGKNTHAHTHNCMFCIEVMAKHSQHIDTHTHIRRLSETSSPLRRRAHAPHLCVQKANSPMWGSSEHAQILIIFIIF